MNTQIILPLLPVIFYTLSGVTDAIMDTLSHHYSKSIFANKNPLLWNPSISWTNKYINHDPNNGLVQSSIFGIRFNKPVQLTDAWHFFKLLREVFNASAIISAACLCISFNLCSLLLTLFMLGTVRNLAFSLFYNKLLIK